MPYHILVVEDDTLFAEYLATIFQSFMGATVDLAQDNASGYKLAIQNKPDLITSDIVRRGGSGIDFFCQLRSDPETAVIPVIIISAKASSTDIELQLYRGGAEGVFTKPFQTEKLLACISHILKLDNDPDIGLLTLGFETRDLDYKEDIDLSDRAARAALAKDVIAMANSGGGTIIVGIAESAPGQFEQRGLPLERIPAFEPTRVADALQKYLGAAVSIIIKNLKWRSENFVLMKIPPSNGTLAMAHCDNEAANLFQGRIYARTNAARSAEVRDSLEVLQLIDRLVEARLRNKREE